MWDSKLHFVINFDNSVLEWDTSSDRVTSLDISDADAPVPGSVFRFGTFWRDQAAHYVVDNHT